MSTEKVKTAAEEVVVLAGVCKAYHTGAGAVPVLRELSLTVERGRSVAITGPSGSGKTTLVNLLAGLDAADTGSIVVAGHDLVTSTSEQLDVFRRRHIGIVFQHHHLLPQCTALENVLLPTLPIGTAPAVAHEKALALLERVGLSRRAEHFPAQLSGGECQRVAVARALINEPAVLLADEPTGSLSGAHTEAIIDLLRSLVDDGATLVTVTHADAVAQAMTCRLVLVDGRLEGAQS